MIKSLVNLGLAAAVASEDENQKLRQASKKKGVMMGANVMYSNILQDKSY